MSGTREGSQEWWPPGGGRGEGEREGGGEKGAGRGEGEGKREVGFVIHS